MCGRYFFHLDDDKAFDKIKSKINQLALFEYATDEIFPGNDALILLNDDTDYTLSVMKWGIKGYHKNRLINARAETLLQKKMFQPFADQRCLIPCNGFYEWAVKGKQKHKMYIQREDTPLFYLAGIYNVQNEFVIVTGESENELKHIHERTPMIITEDQIPQYLKERLKFSVDNEHLKIQQAEPKIKRDTYQMSLFEGEDKEE